MSEEEKMPAETAVPAEAAPALGVNDLKLMANIIEVVSHAKAAIADINGIISIDSDLTTTGALDLNSGAITIDSSTMSIDGTGDSNITVTGSAKDLNLVVAGGGTQELRLLSAGTGASALDLTTSAGGMDINSADMITVDAADEIVITTTSALRMLFLNFFNFLLISKTD